MKTYRSSITIAAPPSRIWSILIDTAARPRWNTTVDKVEGAIALGSTVKVYAKISPGRAFPVKFVDLAPE